MTEPARLLVADPPWKFRDSCPGGGRGASKHYKCLSLDEIKHFPVPLVAKDAILVLWRVAAMAEEAFEVCRAWGFVPKAEIVWIKGRVDGGILRPTIGMGHYVRAAHESAIIASRGKGAGLIQNRGVPSVLLAPRGRHSAKPDEFYRLLEVLVPGPRVELFARVQRPGWQCFGDELPGASAEDLGGAS